MVNSLSENSYCGYTRPKWFDVLRLVKKEVEHVVICSASARRRRQYILLYIYTYIYTKRDEFLIVGHNKLLSYFVDFSSICRQAWTTCKQCGYLWTRTTSSAQYYSIPGSSIMVHAQYTFSFSFRIRVVAFVGPCGILSFLRANYGNWAVFREPVNYDSVIGHQTATISPVGGASW